MKCHVFEERVVDLLRGELDERVRAQALRHALGCGACAARLDRERVLHSALHELAISARGEAAPPAVERALLDAFQKRAVAALGGRDASGWSALLAWRRGRVVVASLAAMVVIALVAVWWLGRAPAPASQSPAQSPAPAPSRVQPATAQAAGNAPAANAQPSLRLGRDRPSRRLGLLNLTPRAAAHREPRRTPGHRPAQPAARAGARLPSPAPASATIEPAEAAAELATDFVALPYATQLRPDEMAKIVRVRVPRSALVRYGLPVSGERIGEPVNADFVLGEDGMARAVRLVQELRFADTNGGAVRRTRLPR